MRLKSKSKFSPHMGKKCGMTGKTIFKSENSALERSSEILDGKDNRNGKQFFRAYICEYCGFFHITSKKLNKR